MNCTFPVNNNVFQRLNIEVQQYHTNTIFNECFIVLNEEVLKIITTLLQNFGLIMFLTLVFIISVFLRLNKLFEAPEWEIINTCSISVHYLEFCFHWWIVNNKNVNKSSNVLQALTKYRWVVILYFLLVKYTKIVDTSH